MKPSKNPLFEFMGQTAKHVKCVNERVKAATRASRVVVSEETLEAMEAKRTKWRQQQRASKARKRAAKPPRVLKHDAETRAKWAKYRREWKARKKMEAARADV